MANKKSDNLFRLVHSLTKAEKRYFTIFASHHIIGENNGYMILFNAVEKQKSFSDEELLVKLKHHGFSKRLSITKNRLYSAILKSLDSFYANTSVELQTKRLVESAAILFRKSLNDQCRKVLHQARKQALKHELHMVLVEIGRWEKRLIEKNNYEEISVLQLEKIREDDLKLVGQLENFNKLWNAKSNLFFAIYRQGKVRSEAELTSFKKMIDELSEEQAIQNNDTETNYLIHHLHSAYYFGTGEYAQCYPYLKKIIGMIEKHPSFFNRDPIIPLSVLSNAVYVGARLGKKKESYSWLEKLRKLTSSPAENHSADMQVKMFSLRASTELMLYVRNEDYRQGLAAFAEIEEGMKKFDEGLSGIRKSHLLFNMAVILFGCGNYHNALKTINRLLNLPASDQRTDIFCMAQILNLIIHFELGNRDMLPYALKTTKRYLVSRKRVYRFETIMLSFINEMIKKRRDKTDEEMFMNLAAELEPLTTHPFESTVFEYFDFLGWAKAGSIKKVIESSAA
ncbi:MAG: hypothetical protein SH856_11650 [Flavobacteriales bacterium]|nr:hypothetical protein [Flavobacteriales bacterium]